MMVTYYSITHTQKDKIFVLKYNQTFTVTGRLQRQTVLLSLPVCAETTVLKSCIFFRLTNTGCSTVLILHEEPAMFISSNRHLRTFPSVGVRTGWDAFSVQVERTLCFAAGATGEDSDMGTKPRHSEGGGWFVSLAPSLKVEAVDAS